MIWKEIFYSTYYLLPPRPEVIPIVFQEDLNCGDHYLQIQVLDLKQIYISSERPICWTVSEQTTSHFEKR